MRSSLLLILALLCGCAAPAPKVYVVVVQVPRQQEEWKSNMGWIEGPRTTTTPCTKDNGCLNWDVIVSTTFPLMRNLPAYEWRIIDHAR